MGFFSKDIKTLDDLFVHTLRDIYYAEKQIEKSLPKMIDKATNPQLKAGFEKHLGQTRGHIERVEQVFELHGVKAKEVTCQAIDGILAEADEVSGDVDDKQVLDAASNRFRTGGRALRDDTLRHVDRLGQATRQERLRRCAREKPAGGERHRQDADPDG